MLSSITPLGQRSRGMSWARTVIAFWIGAIAGGVLLFSFAGLLGDLTNLGALNPWFAVVVIATAGVLDLLGVTPLGLRRQVDEDWLGGYRDWVVGFGFGAQLGLGFTTYVTTWGTWALLLVGASLGLELAVIVGVAFGVGRSMLLLANRRVHTTGALAERMRRFAAGESAANRVATAGYAVSLLLVGVNVV